MPARKNRRRDRDEGALPLRLRQVLWFVGLWIASIVVLSTVAYVIRAAIL